MPTAGKEEKKKTNQKKEGAFIPSLWARRETTQGHAPPHLSEKTRYSFLTAQRW